MSARQLLALALGATVVFWMVGAYNRLVRLRNAINQAWAKVDEAVGQRMAAVEPLLAALRQPLAHEQGALDALQAAHASAMQAATALRARPLHEPHARGWVAAEAVLSAAGSRVFALIEPHAELALQPAVAAPSAAWHDAGSRLAFARQLYNEAAEQHDAALAMFPTRVLTPLFGFRRAGRI